MPGPERVVLASGNAGKLAEISALLAPLNVEVIPQRELGVEDADETGTTFEENALQKARHAARQTGLAAIADDSGLAVDALGGRPGVYSARYAGTDASDDDNIDKLLQDLADVDDRAGEFRCVACYVESADAEPVVATGSWRGEILRERHGTGGFGYDPVFFDPASGCASAELTAGQKNSRSHRGQAFRALADRLAAAWGDS